MKNHLFKTLLAFLIFNFNYSQDKFNFGIKVGLNMNKASISNNSNKNSDTYIGQNIGFIFEIKLKNEFYIQPELNFIKTGVFYSYTKNFSYSNINSTSNGNVPFYSINVPINFKYKIKNKFSVFAGPQLLILAPSEINEFEVNEIIYKEYNGTYENRISKERINGNVFSKDIDYGINVGGDYNFYKGFFTDIRYYIGLNDVSIVDKDYRNKFIQLGVGYKF